MFNGVKLRYFRALFPQWELFDRSGSKLELSWCNKTDSAAEWLPVSLAHASVKPLHLFFNHKANLESLHRVLIEEIFHTENEMLSKEVFYNLLNLTGLPVEPNVQIRMRLTHDEELITERVFKLQPADASQ